MEKDSIQTFIEELLSASGISVEKIELIEDSATGGARFMLYTEESHLLIGKDGETLRALNHVFKKAIQKKQGYSENEHPRKIYAIDINGYKTKRDTELKNKALMLAERARFFKSSIEMDPMNPYDRMVVHSVLAETPDIKTESTGFGMGRRVVIKYVAC
ncbi:MAG: hypothetical protein HZC03_01520 [Candidatus Lloydbacteria bacterium]|nr:hypothetical protein [Candidatus Lloydbacteria bacterium]